MVNQFPLEEQQQLHVQKCTPVIPYILLSVKLCCSINEIKPNGVLCESQNRIHAATRLAAVKNRQQGKTAKCKGTHRQPSDKGSEAKYNHRERAQAGDRKLESTLAKHETRNMFGNGVKLEVSSK